MTDAELFQEFLEFKKFKEQQGTMTVKEPIKPKKYIPRRRAKGSGSIYCLKGNRSKPWTACITVGRDENGSQIQKTLGYFATQGDAQTALSAYELQSKGLIEDGSLIATPKAEDSKKDKCPTFKEIFDILYNTEINKLSYSSQTNNKVGFNHLFELHSIPINQITLHTLQPIFDKVMKKGAGISKLNMMKVVCAKVFKYAMKYDYIDKDYSQYISIESTNERIRNRRSFTKKEIKDLFKLNTLEAKLILCFVYTGLRPQELLNIEKHNVHLDQNYMIGGLKTDNGIDRIIPIHNIIKPFIQELMNYNHKYLVYDFNGRKAYEEYRSTVFHPTMGKIGVKSDPYNTRHTFATLCNESELNEYLIKKMMGHSSNDLTKDVYTHATIERLVNEVNQLPKLD